MDNYHLELGLDRRELLLDLSCDNENISEALYRDTQLEDLWEDNDD